MIVDLLPYMTATSVNPDFNASDAAFDTEQMMIRNGAIQDFLEGKCSVHQMLEIVDGSGIPAEDYADQVVTNVQYLLGRHYCQSTQGILIPV